MKNTPLLFLVFCLALSACRKEDVGIKNEKLAANTRIKYIIKKQDSYLTKVRDTFLFEYEGNRISKLNDFDFFYDNQNRLVQIGKIVGDTSESNYSETFVFYRYDTIFYNYYRIGDKVMLIKDSVMTERTSYRDQQLFSTEYQSNVGAYSQIFYKDERVDSIKYGGYEEKSLITNQVKPMSQAFSYDHKGNISRIHSQIPMNFPVPSGVGVPAYSVHDAVADFQYDNHPNPYNILYRQLGTFIVGMEEASLSPNNRVTSETRIDMGDGDAIISTEYRYEYNFRGLPVSVKAINPVSSVVIEETKFGYY